jgi:hypothetical protein
MKKTTAMPFFLNLPAGAQRTVLKGTISDTAAKRNLGYAQANPFLLIKGFPRSKTAKSAIITHYIPGCTLESRVWHIMI